MKISKEIKENKEKKLGIRACFAIVGWLQTDGIRNIDITMQEIQNRIKMVDEVKQEVYTKTDIAKLFVISEREINEGYAILPKIGKIKIIREGK